jgi:signal peptidase I
LEVVLEEFNNSEGIPTSEAPQQTSEEKMSWKGVVRDVIETLVLAAFLFFLINSVSARVRVDGFSMRPTLDDGQLVLINKLAYRLGEPHRGDIVVFRFPMNPQEDLIKRVIGLPGDYIKVENGTVFANNEVINEPYIAASPNYDGEWIVPEGNLFVLGDNRNDSLDSHEWGVLPLQNVIGKALLIYWPPVKWDLLQVNYSTHQ